MRRGALVLGLLALVAVDTLGQVAFKLAASSVAPVDFSQAFFGRIVVEPWILAIAAAYLAAFLLYMTLMRKIAIGPLFAAAHLEIVAVAILSVVFFGEHLNLVQLLGCLAIVGGVIMLAVTESEAEKP